jgi:hypothetical protein
MMTLLILSIWGCMPELSKDCIDMTNASSTYLGVVIGAIIGGLITWWVYNTQNKTEKMQGKMLDKITELEQMHIETLDRIEILDKNHDNMLNKITELELMHIETLDRIEILDKNHDMSLRSILEMDKNVKRLVEEKG